MRRRMLNEADDFSINVQVGPKKAITANCSTSPVDIAKMDPGSVAIAGKHCDSGLNEFYVDASDVFKLAKLNEISVMTALNNILDINEAHGITPDNLIMVMNEETLPYVDKLEANGVNCMRFVNEDDDISMDIQVGPSDEIRVSEDPQTANPVDAVKRNYDSVVVAKSGDNFFTDVEDVQKCADLNCESVIDTLNNILDVNESTGVSADNLVCMYDEHADADVVAEMANIGVILEARFHFLPIFKREKYMKNYLNTIKDAENALNDEGEDADVTPHQFGTLALRILDILNNYLSIGTAAAVFINPLVTIPAHLITKMISYHLTGAEERVAANEGQKVLAKYNALIKKEKDPKVKEKLEHNRDTVANALNKFNNKR